MRYLVRNELNTEKPINLKELSPLMKMYAGIATSWHQSTWYQRKVRQREERAHMLMVQQDERLKDALLVNLYKELSENNTLKGKDVCKEVILAIDHKYEASFMRIKNHKDFVLYDINLVEEDNNFRGAFSEMPLLIRVKKKVI